MQTALTDTQVGAHQVHLTTTAYSNPIACRECHKVPATVGEAGHIDNMLPAEVSYLYSSLANTFHSVSASTPTYSYANATCSTTYCHDGQFIENGPTWSNGTGTTPRWNNPAYISSDSAPTVADCAKCHGYPPGGTHSTGTGCSGCHDHVDGVNNTSFLIVSRHVDGQVQAQGGDACTSCHSSLSANHDLHSDRAYFLAGKTMSAVDYGKSPWWYEVKYTAGVPKYSCGYCHPQSAATHQGSGVNLNFSPSDGGAAGTIKAMNHSTQTYTQNATPGVSVTCSSVYCHSTGYSPYVYRTTPDWFDGLFSGDRCAACHGNAPTGTSAHAVHRIAIHEDNIFSGTSGTVLKTGAINSGAAHGDPNTATTINCNVCHYTAVEVSYNDQNPVCLTCHTGGTAKGNMVTSTTGTAHVNGAVDVVFAPIRMKTRAQLRTASIPAAWTRIGDYKTAVTVYDQSTTTLSSSPTYSTVLKNCTVSCHNNQAVSWPATGVGCLSCHTAL
jgi:predicted CxxxxCH...CXXCH cytochrome family protein